MSDEIPIIFITDTWTVDDIKTEDDCDDAHALLTAVIVSIEAHMDDLEIKGQSVSVEYKRAKMALRWKKAAMAVVNVKRGQINRSRAEAVSNDRNARIIRYFMAMHPAEFRQASLHVAAGTDKMDSREVAA